MFWRRKKPPAAPPLVGCFGKLPATGDFVRLNAGGSDVAALDMWFSGAIEFAQQRLPGGAFEAAYQRAFGLFIHRGEGKGSEPPARGLIGAWAASGDNAGRLYPMIVFGSYDYHQLVAAGPALPIAVWPLITAAYELATAGRIMPPDAFLERASRIVPPSLEDPEEASAGYRTWLAAQTMKALWETAYGNDAVRFWVLHNINASVEPFRGQELPQTALSLRLPLGAGDAYAVAVWMDMTLRLARWERTLLNAFWTPQQTVLIHLGPPHVASLREMMAPTGNADHVADLCGVPSMDEARCRHALGPALDALVARTDLSLSSFLDGLGG